MFETADSFQSAEVKWFKIKELENGFQEQEFRPVVRSQSSIKEVENKNNKEPPARQIYWASDLKQPDWSIKIDSLELDDAAMYRCDLKVGADKEKMLLELVVERKPAPK